MKRYLLAYSIGSTLGLVVGALYSAPLWQQLELRDTKKRRK